MKKLFSKAPLHIRLGRKFSSPASVIQAQIDLMHTRGYLYDQSIKDSKMRVYFVSALVNPNILRDGYLTSAKFYKTFKDYFAQNKDLINKKTNDFDVDQAREVFVNSVGLL